MSDDCDKGLKVGEVYILMGKSKYMFWMFCVELYVFLQCIPISLGKTYIDSHLDRI